VVGRRGTPTAGPKWGTAQTRTDRVSYRRLDCLAAQTLAKCVTGTKLYALD